MMLGYLLARQGIDVVVLEKHRDFFRDFRGDTVHPSTLEVMHELGLLDQFLRIPHQKLTSASVTIGGEAFSLADFTHVPARCGFIALMPQWDLLDFLAQQGSRYPGFHVLMEHEVTGLTRADDGAVTGIEARTRSGGEERKIEISATLTVACDGRRSTVREAAGLTPTAFGVPIDVLWFRISRRAEDAGASLGNVNYGKLLVLINRAEYFQAGLIVRKGSFDEIKRAGLDALRRTIGELAPFLRDRTGEIASWDDVKLLSVQIDRLPRWYAPGLLCIGDAAHAMSPAGGVGINLAIQDAVASANLLAESLRANCITETQLARVQRRREFPARVIQAFQVRAHRGFARAFAPGEAVQPPWQLRALVQIPGFRQATGYLIGMGVRPEHVAGRGRKRVGIAGAIVAGCAAAVVAFFAVRCLARRA